MSGRRYLDEEAEVSSDDEDYKGSADEQDVDDDDDDHELSDIIAEEDEVDAEHDAAANHRPGKGESTVDLVDDDYLLLEEHHGVRFKRKRQPDQAPPTSAGVAVKHSRLQKRVDIVDDEEDESGRRSDEYSEDEYQLSDDEEEVERRPRRRASKSWLVDDMAPAKQKSRSVRPASTRPRSTSQFGDAGDIFGDMTEFLATNVAEVDDEEATADSMHPDDATPRSRQVEPLLAKRHMVTAADQLIRATDIPELQQSRVKIRSSQVPLEADAKEAAFLEAEWIHQTKFNTLNLESVLPVIINVLVYIREDNFDIPYIQHYLKDYFTPLTPADIWTIDDCDRKWDHLLAKKDALTKQLEKNLPNEKGLIDNLTTAADEDEIEDIRSYLNFFIGEQHVAGDNQPGSVRRPQRRQAGVTSTAMSDASLAPLISQLFLESRQFGANVRVRFLQHSPEDPDLMPDATAIEYVNSRYPTATSVLSAARTMCAHRLAADPDVRAAIRARFIEMGLITTQPTAKGQGVIDWTHEYYNVSRLVNKPVSSFIIEANGQFALLHQAELDGFIQVKFHVDPADETTAQVPEVFDDVDGEAEMGPFLSEFAELFQSTSFSRAAQMWNRQRRLIFKEAARITMERATISAIRDKLLHQAFEFIENQCGATLRSALYIAPLERSNLVMSCVLGQDRGQSTHVVVIDQRGQLVDHVAVTSLRAYIRKDGPKQKGRRALLEQKSADIRQMRSFLDRYSDTNYIAVGASSIDGRTFMEELNKLTAGRSMKAEFVDGSLAAIAMNSPRMLAEFPDHPPRLRQAICLARLIQDPLSEISAISCSTGDIPICSDLLSLPLHRYQRCVPKINLCHALHRVLIDVVNEVGVDVNLAISQPHLTGPLNFVSGLGPRKSKLIIDFASRFGNRPFQSRDEFTKVLSPLVYKNAIGFLRIVVSANISYCRLDSTRIHPEHYVLSDRIVLNAMDQVEQEQRQGDPRDGILLQLRTPQHIHKLDELDLVAYAHSMNLGGEGQHALTLQLIKAELKVPYQDTVRKDRVPLTEIQLFTLLTGEVPDVTLQIGQIVDVVVSSVPTRFGINVRLDSGLPGQITMEHFSDDMDQIKQQSEDEAIRQVSNRAPIGITLKARIISINFERFRLELTSREADIRDYATWENPVESEQYRMKEDRSASILAEKPKPLRKFIPRNIDHPLFSNVDRETAESMLASQPIGSVVLRPSRLGLDHITLTWKCADDVFVHLSIDESQKPHDVRKALGQVLKIQSDSFEDLDEILARYIRPMSKLSESMIGHASFRFGSEPEIEQLLKDEKEDKPGRIPYFFALSSKHPGTFLFSFLPNQSMKSIPITMCPTGLRFQKKVFERPSQIIAYFKQMFAHQLKKHPKVANPVAAAPNSVAKPVSSNNISSGWGASSSTPAVSAGAWGSSVTSPAVSADAWGSSTSSGTTVPSAGGWGASTASNTPASSSAGEWGVPPASSTLTPSAGQWGASTASSTPTPSAGQWGASTASSTPTPSAGQWGASTASSTPTPSAGQWGASTASSTPTPSAGQWGASTASSTPTPSAGLWGASTASSTPTPSAGQWGASTASSTPTPSTGQWGASTASSTPTPSTGGWGDPTSSNTAAPSTGGWGDPTPSSTAALAPGGWGTSTPSNASAPSSGRHRASTASSTPASVAPSPTSSGWGGSSSSVAAPSSSGWGSSSTSAPATSAPSSSGWGADISSTPSSSSWGAAPSDGTSTSAARYSSNAPSTAPSTDGWGSRTSNPGSTSSGWGNSVVQTGPPASLVNAPSSSVAVSSSISPATAPFINPARAAMMGSAVASVVSDSGSGWTPKTGANAR